MCSSTVKPVQPTATLGATSPPTNDSDSTSTEALVVASTSVCAFVLIVLLITSIAVTTSAVLRRRRYRHRYLLLRGEHAQDSELRSLQSPTLSLNEPSSLVPELVNETSTNVEGEPLSYPRQCTGSSDKPFSLVPGLVIETPACTQSSDEPSSLVPELVNETSTNVEGESLSHPVNVTSTQCTRSSDELSSLVVSGRSFEIPAHTEREPLSLSEASPVHAEREPLSYPAGLSETSAREPLSYPVNMTPTCTPSSDVPSSLVSEFVNETSTNVAREPLSELVNVTSTNVAREPLSELVNVTSSTNVAREPLSELVNETSTNVAREPLSEFVNETSTNVAREPLSEFVNETSTNVAREPLSEFVNETSTNVAREPLSELVNETSTNVAREPLSELVNETSTNVAREPLSELVNVTSSTNVAREPLSELVNVTSSTNVAREPLLQAPDVATPSLEPRETLHHSFMDIHGHSESTPMVQFVDQIDVLKCDSSGMEFTNTDHDITLRVPEGAIPDGVTVHIKAGVALHGPFQFPPGTRPISPIVWFCMQENIPFEKPVEVLLPHFLRHWKNLQLGFLKADHSTYTTDDGEKRYMFQHLNDPMEFCFENGRGFGVLSTKHFCSLCIHVSNITRDQLISKAQYCLTEVIPDPWPSMPIDVPLHFCVTFFLKTCFETLKRQFPSGFKISRRQFTFQTEMAISEPKLQFEVHEPQFGWILALKCEGIRAADVDCWDKEGTKERPDLQLMEDENMYPPRLTIEACGASATKSSLACLRFIGSSEDMYTEVLLPLRHQANALPVSRAPSLSAISNGSYSSSAGVGYAASGSWNCRNYHHLEGIRPSLPALLRFPTERGNINIPQQIGSIHTNIGTFLLDDETGAIVDGIAQEHRGNADNINREILKKWLQGRGRQPVTWRTLIEVLQDSQLTGLADEIQRNLSRLT